MAEELHLPAAAAAGGTALGWLGKWLLDLRKDRRDAAGDAIRALRDALAELRTETDRLAERMLAATESEERCLRRVRMLRDDVHAMRNAMQAAGINVPALPSEAAGAD